MLLKICQHSILLGIIRLQWWLLLHRRYHWPKVPFSQFGQTTQSSSSNQISSSISWIFPKSFDRATSVMGVLRFPSASGNISKGILFLSTSQGSLVIAVFTCEGMDAADKEKQSAPSKHFTYGLTTLAYMFNLLALCTHLLTQQKQIEWKPCSSSQLGT